MRRRNFLTDSNAVYLFDENEARIPTDGYTNDWSITNGTKGFSDVIVYDIFNGTMVIAPTNPSIPVVISLDNFPISSHSSFVDIVLESHIQVQCASRVTVEGQLQEHNQPLPEGKSPKSRLCVSNTWNSCRTNTIDFGPSSDFSLNVSIQYTVSDHVGSPIYVTLPTLHDSNSFQANDYAMTARTYLPDFLYDIDSQQEDPQFPFYKLIDCLSDDAAKSMLAYTSIFAWEPSEVGPEFDITDSEWRSSLTDWEYHYRVFRPWLMQFTGGRLIHNLNRRSVTTTALSTIGSGPSPSTTISLISQPSVTTPAAIDWLSNYPEGQDVIDAIYEISLAGDLTITNSSTYFGLIDSSGDDGFTGLDVGVLASGGSLRTRTTTAGAVVKWRTTGTTWKYAALGDPGTALDVPDMIDSGIAFSAVKTWSSDTLLATRQASDYTAFVNDVTSILADSKPLYFDIGWSTTAIAGPYLFMLTSSGAAALQTALDALSAGDGLALYTTANGYERKVLFKSRFATTSSGVAVECSGFWPAFEPFCTTASNSSVSSVILGAPQRYFTTDSDIDDFQRWQVRNGYYGYRSGTAESLKESARLVLTGDDRVAILPKYNDNPFVIEVRTITSATPDQDPVTTQSQTVLAALEPARPMGYSLIHSTSDEFYLTLGSPGLGLIGYSVLE